MPFPCREIYDFPPSSPYGEMEIKTLPNGKCSSRLVLSRKPLPPCENFALDKILAAGLPLEKVSQGGRGGSAHPARRHRFGQDLHDGESDRQVEPSDAHPLAQQDTCRAALRRTEGVLSRKRRRVLHLLLRLLPARSNMSF